MLRIGSTHITRLYASVSVKHGVVVSSVSIYGMIPGHMGILCRERWDRSPSGNS